MKPLRYIERKIGGLFEEKYEKCNTKEEVLKEQRKTERRIKWGDRALDIAFITYSTFNAVFDSQNREYWLGVLEGYAASTFGRLIYERFTEDPKEKSTERILSGATTSMLVGIGHSIIASQPSILPNSFLGGGIETYFDAFTSELLEKNQEHAEKRIEYLNKK